MHRRIGIDIVTSWTKKNDYHTTSFLMVLFSGKRAKENVGWKSEGIALLCTKEWPFSIKVLLLEA